METNRIKLSSIVESQLPLFVREEYPLVAELLTEYYRSLESKGSAYDILQNIDHYIKVNNLSNLVEKTTTTIDLGFIDNTINVENTNGFPQTYGIIRVDNEIILYKSKTSTSFNDCVRGFSGITEFSVGNLEEFVFSSSETQEHIIGSEVINLGSLFLKEFFNKTKKQFLYGFSDRELYPGINENLFLKQSKDYYSSKGTSRSFQIIFGVLYGKDINVILPRDFLISPSNAQYRVTINLAVESIQGNPEELLNQTIFQDEFGGIQKSFGTVTSIQRSFRNNEEYYILKIDYDYDKDINVSGSVFGDFKSHPRTTTITDIKAGSTIIDVDSTIGFPESGTIVLNGEFGSSVISYNGKTINQFLNCSGISSEFLAGTKLTINSFAYGYSPRNEQIRFRITNVLSVPESFENSRYYQNGNIGDILYLGYDEDNIKDTCWVFNASVKCDVLNFTSDGNFKYTIETYDNNGVYEGDSVQIEYIDKNSGQRNISVIPPQNVKIGIGGIPGKIFQIQTSGYEISNIFNVKKVVAKYDDYIADISNVYKDLYTDDRYIAASSLPYYDSIESKTVKIPLNGSFSGSVLKIVADGQSHGFITGDAVLYAIENLDVNATRFDINPGAYYVKRESDTEIRLARSRSDIYYEKFISVGSTTVFDNILSLLRFSNNNLPLSVGSQNLMKVLRDPIIGENEYETPEDTIGILINGVEILNYKSEDKIYYGELKSIEVLSPGKNLDIINPPVLEITDSEVTLSARGYCGVEGSLNRIDIIDSGFNYIDTPTIQITGGGGIGANASVNMIEYDHSVNFNASPTNSKIGISSGIIGFSTYHKFRDGEFITYKTNNNTPIGGLSTSSGYYARVINNYGITLHNKQSDAISGINTVSITSYGVGNHTFESTEKKRKVGSISIKSPGTGYKNKKISVPTSGINTATNTINTNGHPFSSGEIIYYYGGAENVSGLQTGRYVVTSLDSNSFRVSNVGLGTTTSDFYYKTKQFIDFSNGGEGPHIFGYEPIEVTISGKINSPTISSDVDIFAKIQPVFRGKLTSISLYDGGVGYGSSEIINYNRQPNINLNAGSGAKVTPVISNGRIVDVIIDEYGSGYNSPPDLVIRGFGIGAILTPIVSDGKLVQVKVISGGINYEQKNTFIDIVTPLTGYQLESYPQIWTINRFKRLLETNKISADDGVVYQSKNKRYGLQYTHLYAPRSLRKKIYTTKLQDINKSYKKDYQNDFDDEKYHSPLLGWAYDGNPIYGPYGYTSTDNKTVKQILSGYSNLPLDSQPNRPNKKLFPAGYFIEDYVFENSGDLDENNGRFCVTPEFPLGTYAYFMTVTEEVSKSSGVFFGDKIPTFPYIIGKKFKSKPIDYNFNSSSNQDLFDFSSRKLVRNTRIYNNLSDNSRYEYIISSDDLFSQKSTIDKTFKGSIDSIKIISGGENYKIGDNIVFNDSDSGGFGASAKVKSLKGKPVVGVSKTETKIIDIEFYPQTSTGKIIGFSSVPHNLNNLDFISIDSTSNYNSILQNSFNVEVKQNYLVLNVGIGSTSFTGITTYFYVSGSLDGFTIRENDIFKIGTEEVKVLSVDRDSQRIKVLREQNSSISTSHLPGTLLEEIPRKFYLNSRINGNYNYNKEIYFDPSESLGIGTTSYTIDFSNPGVGLTYITIPERSIYLKDHNLDTGTELIYNSNENNPISVSTDGTSSFNLNDNSIVYVAKLSNDLIGIATNRVALGSSGNFVGVSTDQSILYFTGIGTGNYHSFRTNYSKVLKGNATKTTITVSTASTHQLKINDFVDIDFYPGISTTVYLQYSDYHRVLTANPKTFYSVDVNENIITILNHDYITGQKVIHTSDSSATGLRNQGIYYVIVYDDSRIKLSNSYYGAIAQDKEIVDITTSSYGTLSSINPKIEIQKNNKVIFDLSDSSLSQLYSGIGRTESFDFELFEDKNFNSSYLPINEQNVSKILRYGNVGIDTTARVEFTVDSEFPEKIYYNLIPKTNLSVKNEIVTDTEVPEYNQISFVLSELNQKQKIVGVSSNTFSFSSKKIKENLPYSSSDGIFQYFTDSTNSTGEIHEFNITSNGKFYSKLPYVTTIESNSGSNAIVLPQSNNIGKIETLNLVDVGYDYPTDYTLLPLVKFPTIARVEPFSSIDYVKVENPGKNYNTNPDLIVIDGFTNIVSDAISHYNILDNEVNIIKNTKSLYNATPRVVTINNSNGVGISSISYNDSTKNVTAFLNKQFSALEDFPFSIGQNVYVEGVSVLSTEDKGYNSSSYSYNLFPIVGVNTSVGGSGAYIEYSLNDFIGNSENPGTFDSLNSSGRVIVENDLPTFEIATKKNSYIIGESITTDNGSSGKVLSWDKNNEYLTIKSNNNYLVGELIVGESSKSESVIKEIITYETFYDIKSSSISLGGWNNNTGFLNDSLQRIHDNDYYQYFSYSIQSEIPIEEWNDVVSNLNHTLGFKKFGDLIVESIPEASGIQTSQNEGTFSATADLNSSVDIDCIIDYDLVSENNFYIEGKLTSDEINFNSAVLQDYSQSIGNRVLNIDDISDEFNTSITRTFVTSFSI